MKKYIMPIVKVAAIKPTVILTGSDVHDEVGNGSIMSKESQSSEPTFLSGICSLNPEGLFDTEDDI